MWDILRCGFIDFTFFHRRRWCGNNLSSWGTRPFLRSQGKSLLSMPIPVSISRMP